MAKKGYLGTPEERFWRKVKKTSGCWLWVGGCLRKGYGQFKIDGRRVYVHRFSWGLHYGPIPDGMDVLHQCDNPPCVRPDHLFLGTLLDNIQDMCRKRRNRVPHPRAAGERNHNAKLTAQHVREIKRSNELGTVLSRRYGVSPSTICLIRKRKTWRSVAEAGIPVNVVPE